MVQRGTEAFPRRQERDKSNRIKNRSGGGGIERMATAILLVLVAVGSVVFHFLSPWWWTPIASNWAYIDHTIIITFWITGVVFVAVVLFTAYCVYRFRHRPGNEAHYEPENKRLEWWLTVVTGIGVAAMLAPGLYVWHQFVTVPADATEIEVVGRQWSWAYRLPGKDGRLGTSDTRNVSPDNPLGVNAHDPNGKDDVVIDGDDLHLPIGKPVKVLLRSIDVLHDFYVPEFRSKMDMIPGSSPISGSPRRGPAPSTCCVPSSAASVTRRCAARSSSRRRANTRPGSKNSRPSPSLRARRSRSRQAIISRRRSKDNAAPARAEPPGGPTKAGARAARSVG